MMLERNVTGVISSKWCFLFALGILLFKTSAINILLREYIKLRLTLEQNVFLFILQSISDTWTNISWAKNSATFKLNLFNWAQKIGTYALNSRELERKYF